MLRRIGRWGKRVLVSCDQVGSALTGGDPDETISSRLGRLKRRNGGRIPWRRPFSKILDGALELVDPGHSLRAIEDHLQGYPESLLPPPPLPAGWTRHRYPYAFTHGGELRCRYCGNADKFHDPRCSWWVAVHSATEG